MFNLHHLQIFQTVAALESYSRAAERLGISQPAVSMQVAKLEESVGLPLVQSRGRRLELTEAGRELYAYTQRIFGLFDEAEQAMDDYRAVRRGRLRVAASSTPGCYVLPGVIAAYRRTYPGVEVALTINNTQTALLAVADGLADLAVVGELPPDATEVEVAVLCRDCLAVVAAPGHRWAAGGPIRPADLAAEPLILREEGSSTRAVLDRRLREAGLSLSTAMDLGSTEAVKQAVAAGLGASVLSGWAVRWELAAGLLVRVPVTGLSLERSLHLCFPRGAALTGPVARFVEQLRAADLTGGCRS